MCNKLLLFIAIILSMTAASVWAKQAPPVVGAVYAMTNDLNANEIVVFDRHADGSLTLNGRVATQGQGGFAGDPVDALGSQNSLILSENNRWLLAVNAGSNEISVFRVAGSGLLFVEKVNSGGEFPVSLALDGDLLYVLNSGGAGNITGFTLTDGGHLEPLTGSTRSLNAGGTNPPLFVESPAQVGFDPSGEWLVVTLKKQNRIDVFAVDKDGLPSAAPVESMANGTTPFSFTFDRRGRLLVVEAFGQGNLGDAGAGAVSSYQIQSDGSLEVISGSVGNTQTAACWLIRDHRGLFAYVSNNGDSTISSYRIRPNGGLVLRQAVAGQAMTRPVDIGMTLNGRFLYSLNAGTGTVSAFRVEQPTGALNLLGQVGGLPVENGAVGLAVR